MLAAQWDALPWWQQTMYLNGLNASRRDPDAGDDLDDVYPFGFPESAGGPQENLVDLGVKVVRVQFGKGESDVV